MKNDEDDEDVLHFSRFLIFLVNKIFLKNKYQFFLIKKNEIRVYMKEL
jgi:hypothetical protein